MSFRPDDMVAMVFLVLGAGSETSRASREALFGALAET
jgi:hypothetical protein